MRLVLQRSFRADQRNGLLPVQRQHPRNNARLLCLWAESSNTSLNGVGASCVAHTTSVPRSVPTLKELSEPFGRISRGSGGAIIPPGGLPVGTGPTVSTLTVGPVLGRWEFCWQILTRHVHIGATIRSIGYGDTRLLLDQLAERCFLLLRVMGVKILAAVGVVVLGLVDWLLFIGVSISTFFISLSLGLGSDGAFFISLGLSVAAAGACFFRFPGTSKSLREVCEKRIFELADKVGWRRKLPPAP